MNFWVRDKKPLTLAWDIYLNSICFILQDSWRGSSLLNWNYVSHHLNIFFWDNKVKWDDTTKKTPIYLHLKIVHHHLDIHIVCIRRKRDWVKIWTENLNISEILCTVFIHIACVDSSFHDYKFAINLYRSLFSEISMPTQK